MKICFCAFISLLCAYELCLHSKMFVAKFLFSSLSFAVLNLCGAFLIELRTFRTPGLSVWSDRRPLAPLSAIVGKAELLFRFIDPMRKERDKARDSGRSPLAVEFCEEDGDDDASAFRSSSVVTNLSNKTSSASLFDVRFPAAVMPPFGSTSESCNDESLIIISSPALHLPRNTSARQEAPISDAN